MMLFVAYKDRDTMARNAAAIVAGQLAAALSKKGRATLAVPGGTTPGPFLSYLAQAEIDWPGINVVLTDERVVSETDQRSNTRLLKETLLTGRASHANLVPMTGSENNAEALAKEVAPAVDAVLPLDVCVLGMGTDMHVASLFPDGNNLEQALADNAPSVLAMRAASTTEPRLTLTAPALKSAGFTHVLITGKDKRRALERAEGIGSEIQAPVRVVMSNEANTNVHYAQ